MFTRIWRSTSGLVVIVTSVFTIATLLIGGIAYEVTHEALEQQLDHRIAMETSALLAETGDSGLAAVASAVRRRDAARSTSSLDYLLVDDEGRRLAGELIAEVPEEGYLELLDFRDLDTAQRGTAQALTSRIDGGTLVVAASREDLNEIDRTLLTLFSAALAAMLAAGIVASMLVGWITRNRLARIDATAKAIIQGDLGHRIPRDGSGSEFDRLASTLNQMLDRIAALMTNLRQVSTDVAHDLRTPLTRLSNRLDSASVASELSDVKEQLAAARAEADQLLELFTALLRIAEIEGTAEHLPRHPVDLSALVEQLAETYRPDMEQDRRELIVTAEPDVVVTGDKRLISQLIANLFDNVLRHTPEGTVAEIVLRRGADSAILTVRDYGPGIEPEATKWVFQRFARVEKARSRPGHGLGLAIVSSIATAHGGSASIPSTRPFEVRIEIPLSALSARSATQ